MKRTINVKVSYDLDDPELQGLQIVPKEKAQEVITEEMIEVFGWEEGYCGVEVEVIDIP